MLITSVARVVYIRAVCRACRLPAASRENAAYIAVWRRCLPYVDARCSPRRLQRPSADDISHLAQRHEASCFAAAQRELQRASASPCSPPRPPAPPASMLRHVTRVMLRELTAAACAPFFRTPMPKHSLFYSSRGGVAPSFIRIRCTAPRLMETVRFVVCFTPLLAHVGTRRPDTGTGVSATLGCRRDDGATRREMPRQAMRKRREKNSRRPRRLPREMRQRYPPCCMYFR